jgi:hypothetical protein
VWLLFTEESRKDGSVPSSSRGIFQFFCFFRPCRLSFTASVVLRFLSLLFALAKFCTELGFIVAFGLSSLFIPLVSMGDETDRVLDAGS